MAKSLEQTKTRRGIQSVGIGLRVLSALAVHKGAASLTTIAQGSDLSASQTHRYLSSLMAAGMVKQEQRSGLYDLDSGAIRLGLAALSRIDVFAMADEYFSEFARETGRTCLLAIWGDAGPTIVRWFDGDPPVITSLAIGSVLPPYRSATGRIFVAFGNQSRSRIPRREIEVMPDIEANLDRTRETGIAEVQGDLIPGLRAFAAPVFDLQGRLVLVASAIANESISAADDAKATAALVQTCKKLTEALGGPWLGRTEKTAEAKRGRTPNATNA